MFKRLGMSLWLIGFIFLCSTEASAQVYTESVTIDPSGRSRSGRAYYMPKMFKFVEADGNTVIMRFDREHWLSLDHEKKQYWQMTFAELEARMAKAGGQMDAAMAEMEKKLASLPPEQRRQIEAMMGKQLGLKKSPGRLAVRKGSETRTIAGLRCTRHSVTEDGQQVLELWTTTEVREFAKLRQDYERFAKSMAAMQGQGGAMNVRARAWGEAMKAIDGFPLETDSSGIKNTVTKLERRSIPVAEFEIPSGYKKIAPPF